MLNINEETKSFSDISEIVAERLLDMLAKGYSTGSLALGNNLTDIYKEKEVFYKLQCSLTQHEFLYIKKKNSNQSMSYEIELETIGNETPVQLTIGIDESLAEQRLPKEMIKKLDNKFYNFISK